MRKAFSGIWHEERNLADPDVIGELAIAAGLPPSLLERTTKKRPNLVTRQIYKTPSVLDIWCTVDVLDGEIFWGQDRLELLDGALSTRRAAFVQEVPTS